MKNQVIEDRIKYWQSTSHLSQTVFKVDGKTYKLIEIVDQIIELFASESEVQLLDEKILKNFIDGLALLRNDIEISPSAIKSKELTDPVLECIRTIFSSVRLRKIIKSDYIGDDVRKAKATTFSVVSKNPIPPELLIKNSAGYYEYKVAEYSALKPPVKIIKTGILENLHEEFNGKIFNVTENDFISAINDPVNYGHLIKPLPGKQTYVYYLIGQISGHITDQPSWEKHICIALDYDFEIYSKKKSGRGLSDDFISLIKSIIEK